METFKETVSATNKTDQKGEYAVHMIRCMRQLSHTYARKLLIDLLATGAQDVDSFSTETLTNICSLLHNDLKTSYHIEKDLGQSHPLIESRVKIQNVINELKGNKTFPDLFIADFLKRAQDVLKEKTGDCALAFENKYLHKFNLIYFQN